LLDVAARAEPKPNAADQAHAAIRRKILDAEWPPGASVLEGAIALELGLSRTPVREALVRLQQEGLIEIVPRHGMRVSALSQADMREIYQVLTTLEPAAVELLAERRPSRAVLAPLYAACDAMARSLRGPKPDLRAWAAADEDFHAGLARLCGNRRLAAMIMTVWDQAHRARMFTLSFRPLPRKSTEEHRAVLDAIADGDAARASSLYAAHRRRGGAELMAIIEKHGIRQL
jgi:DNA-binding GntR family transcriptional regulator